MTTIYCTDVELKALLYGREELIEKINHISVEPHIDDSIKQTKKKKKVLRYEDVRHPFFNPKENSVIIFDRRVIERDFKFLTEYCGIIFREKLFQTWKDRNVKVIFNFSCWEPMMCESNLYDFMIRDFPFECIKLVDYPTFKDKPNFYYDGLYNIFHYINEHLEGDIESFPKKPHSMEKEKLFAFTQMKLRPHRVYFLKKLISSGLYKHGYITGMKGYFEEYNPNQLGGGSKLTSDNCYMQSEYYYKDNIWDFFEKGWDEYKDIIVDNFKDNPHQNYTKFANNTLEYNKTYIDIAGETHILFNTQYPTFSEKSLQAIMFEKMFLIYGGNEFYRLLEKLGGHNFFEELGLPEDYHTIENPYEQVDIIMGILPTLSTLKFSEIFEQSQAKIKENKKIIFEHYKKIMKPVSEFILGK